MRRLLFLVFALCLLAWPVHAETLVDRITRQLRAQGYDRVETEGTLLGRTRIEARSRDWEREIIVNPRTGEILRDYSEHRAGSSGKGGQAPESGLLDTKDDDQGQSRGRKRGGDDDGKDSDSNKDPDNESDSDKDSDSDSDSGGDD